MLTGLQLPAYFLLICWVIWGSASSQGLMGSICWVKDKELETKLNCDSTVSSRQCRFLHRINQGVLLMSSSHHSLHLPGRNRKTKSKKPDMSHPGCWWVFQRDYFIDYFISLVICVLCCFSSELLCWAMVTYLSLWHRLWCQDCAEQNSSSGILKETALGPF